MRVLFVYPSIDSPVGFNHGLAAMSGILRAQGHETSLIHVCESLAPIPSLDEMVEMVRAEHPGVIGFSCMSQQYAWARDVARHLVANGVSVPIVVGGVHCTMVPKEVVEHPEWDGVFVGECDAAFPEYVRRLEAGEDTSTNPNLRFRRNGSVVSNPVGPFPDIASFPPKDYDLFDIGRILEAKNGWVSILTSRGCPYQCTYCFNREIVDLYKAEGAVKVTRDYLRHYAPGRIIEEIMDLDRRFPGQLKTVIFDDDLFTLKQSYVVEFCDAYVAAGVNVPFVVNAHPQVFGDAMAAALAKAGCLIVKFGLESGSHRVRKEVLRRPMSNDKIANAFAAAHRHGLHTSAFIMAGLPTETRSEIEETLQLCADVEMGRFRWAIFFPFPGTAAHALSAELGLIDEEKAEGLGNYFDGSCLRLGDAMDLYVDKLTWFAHWYVNARTRWPSREIFRSLVAEIDAMDRETWRSRRDELKAFDREHSEKLLAEDVLHYMRQFYPVMGVRSDFVKRDRERLAAGETESLTEYSMD